MGDDYVYWTDYNHKNLWALRKDGTSKSPMILRTYARNPAMGVVIFRHKPLDCIASFSPEFHDETIASKEETTTIVLSITCFVLLGIAITLTFWWSNCKQLLVVSNKNEGTFAFRNFQNCSTSVAMPGIIHLTPDTV